MGKPLSISPTPYIHGGSTVDNILSSQVTSSIQISTSFSSILATPLRYLYILLNNIIVNYINTIYYLLYKLK
jgi:hypothetical protein